MSSRPLNVSYLVVGLVYLGISGSWALHASGAVDNGDVQWLLPLVLVGAGVIGLVAFTAKGLTRGRRSDDEQPAVDLYGDEPYQPYEPPYERPYEPPYEPTAGVEPQAQPSGTENENETEKTTDPTMRIEGEER